MYSSNLSIPPLRLSLRLIELKTDKQVMAKKKSNGLFIAVLINILSLFNIFLAIKLNVRKPINRFCGAEAIDIENGISIINQ
jgi:hypothetical protein